MNPRSFFKSFLSRSPRILTERAESQCLKRWAAGRSSLAEIGVFDGHSALNLRSVMDPKGTLHLIDPFIADSMKPELKAHPLRTYMNLTRVRRGRLKWHRDFSHNVIKGWNTPLDFLFIDGDHDEAACTQDWLDWSPHLQDGGIVIFHDARLGIDAEASGWTGWPGPTAVTTRLFRNPETSLREWTIVDEVGSMVVVEKRSRTDTA